MYFSDASTQFPFEGFNEGSGYPILTLTDAFGNDQLDVPYVKVCFFEVPEKNFGEHVEALSLGHEGLMWQEGHNPIR